MFPHSFRRSPAGLRPLPAWPRTAACLAVACACAAGAAAEPVAAVRIAPAAEGAPVPAQTWFPVPGLPDPERAATSAAAAVRADLLHRRAIGGRGVTVAVLDTGLAAHAEFAEAGKLLPGFNAIDGSSDVRDRKGHGTHVAGILAGARDGRGIHGIAYDARILPIKVFADDGSGSTRYADAGLRHAIGRAAIVNMSFGSPGRHSADATRAAVRAGLLLVAAAGNSGEANPQWPARFAREAWANNQIIVVGAVDAQNRLAAFSNRAGDTAPWYLVAPGVDILSAHLDGRYVALSGTSMATPVVSGAAALVKQLWPYLRAEQIAAILLVTATDLGAPGIDPVYGRGLLNLEKALQPIGAVRTTSADGSAAALGGTSLRPSAATSELWRLARSGALRMMARDEYGRGYEVDLGSVTSRPAALSLDQVFGTLDRRVEIADRVLDSGARLTMAWEGDARPAPPGAAGGARKRLAGFSLSARSPAGLTLDIGSGMAARGFGAGALALDGAGLAAASLDLPALANPYLALAPQAAHLAFGHAAGGLQWRAGVVAAGGLLAQAQSVCDRDPDPVTARLPAQVSSVPRVDQAVFELSRGFGDAALSFTVLRMRERGGYIGAHADGILRFGPRISTRAAQLSGAMRLGAGVALAGQAAFGITPGDASRSRVIADVSDTRANAYSVALVASDRLVIGDRMTFSLAQPLRTYAGRMTLDVIAAIDDGGNEVRERRVFSMAPSARETMAEAGYFRPLGGGASLSAALSLRRHPNNLVDAAMERLVAVRYFRAY